MRSRRIVRRSFLLSSFITFLLLACSPTLAGTINVLGFVDFGPVGSMPIGRVNLGGDRGFTLTFSDNLSVQTAAANCSFPECPPGATINLHAFASTDFGGGARLDGVSYRTGCQGIDPFPCGNAFIQFTGQTVAPPFGDFTKAILKVPVEFGGFFSHSESSGFGSEQLVASAVATLTLDKIDNTGFPGVPGPIWRYDGIRYELEPVPEPTTLLLLGSSLAGIFVQGMWRRR
jgi:hypothetical protein